MMQEHRAPAMSVVLATDVYATIRTTIRHLRAQTIKEQLEIILVAPSAAQLGLVETELRGFLRYRVVEVPGMKVLPWGRAVGTRHATAAVVAFLESHSYPQPGWAEALVEAHRSPSAAVGPVLDNANPGSMISWAGFLLDYGHWIDPAPPGVIDDLPGHNSSYKRAVLLSYGPRLEAMLEMETILHWDLRAKGHQLYLEPRAKTRHLNVSLPSSWLPERFFAARWFGGARARHKPAVWRLFYTAAAPLIPLVRLRRILGYIRRSGRYRELVPRVLPVLLLSLIVSALGEMVGYACGIGNVIPRVSEWELHKVRHLAAFDKVATTAGDAIA
jgi:Glycosyl transferase family 2